MYKFNRFQIVWNKKNSFIIKTLKTMDEINWSLHENRLLYRQHHIIHLENPLF